MYGSMYGCICVSDFAETGLTVGSEAHLVELQRRGALVSAAHNSDNTGLVLGPYLVVLAANGGAVNIAVGSHEADGGEEGRDGLHGE